jgi:hypothetical protein
VVRSGQLPLTPDSIGYFGPGYCDPDAESNAEQACDPPANLDSYLDGDQSAYTYTNTDSQPDPDADCQRVVRVVQRD